MVTFTLPLPGHIDPNSADIQQMMLQYNVTIHIKPVCPVLHLSNQLIESSFVIVVIATSSLFHAASCTWYGTVLGRNETSNQ